MAIKTALTDFRAEVRESIDTALERDPAATSRSEVLLFYPGVHALMIHRVSHRLWKRGYVRLARGISHISRSMTGIEIHPGAEVGRRFFIDHGMGVVIGETAIIGNDVTIYHGVTLGGTSTTRTKRHPTVEDHVVIGAGATVLGPVTLGTHTRVGAGSVVVTDAPAGSTVVGVPAKIVQINGEAQIPPEAILNHGDLPDPAKVAFDQVFARMKRIEDTLQAIALDHKLGALRESPNEAARSVVAAVGAEGGATNVVRPIGQPKKP